MSLFCYKCGNKLLDDARFCSTCGTATITDNIRHEEESESQSHKMEIKKPLEELTVDEYIEIIEREILYNIADWLEQGKIKDAELPQTVTVYAGLLSSQESYEEDKAKGKLTEYLMLPAENKAEVLSRLQIAATYLPVVKEVYEKHKNDKFTEEETPLGHFDNQVALLEAMAKKGGINMMTKLFVQDLYENIFQHISKSAIRESQKLTRQQKVLTLYLDTETIISTLQERWKNDRTKRKSSLFGKP